jgi:hypothetical protein
VKKITTFISFLWPIKHDFPGGRLKGQTLNRSNRVKFSIFLDTSTGQMPSQKQKMAQYGLPKPGLNQQHLGWYLELALLASLGNVKFRLRDPDLILGSHIYIVYNNPTKWVGKGGYPDMCFYNHLLH